jgi:hypothetical protein
MVEVCMKNWFFIVGLLSFSSQAWDGHVSGKIGSIDVTSGNNYDLRVTLVNGPKLCGNGNTWAYLNNSDSNYQTYVSVLLAAKMAEKNVTIYTSKETKSGNGYCHIGYISMN